jgi:hypothetical protein
VTRLRAAGLAILALGLFGAAAPAAAACKLQKVAELPVTIMGPQKAVVSAKINGVEVKLIADSGASMGGLRPAPP